MKADDIIEVALVDLSYVPCSNRASNTLILAIRQRYRKFSTTKTGLITS